MAWLKHVFEPMKQMELDFGDIESISEARDMLKDNVQRWESEFIQSGIALGLEQGLSQGLSLGREQERVDMFIELMSERFGEPNTSIHQKLEHATPEELKSWTLKILTAQSVDDVFEC